MSTVSIPPVADQAAEPCGNCRAPLAGDQRYCLYCGVRRSDVPGTSLDALVGAATGAIPPVAGTAIVASGPGHVQLASGPLATAQASVPVAVGAGAGFGPPPRPTGLRGWVRGNGPFLSLASVGVGVLIVGLLIGNWTTARSDVPAPTTLTVNVNGAALGAAAPAPTTASDAAAPATDQAADADAGDQAAEGGDPTAPLPKDAVSAKDLSAKDIEKAAKKGKPITTGDGPLPPKDDKPAGGGSDFEEIG